jgi:hypothetical protein
MKEEEKKLHARLAGLKEKLEDRDRRLAELDVYMPPKLRGVQRQSEGLDRVQSDLQRAHGYLEKGQAIPARAFLDRAEDRLLSRRFGPVPGSIGRTVRDADKGRQHSDAQSGRARKERGRLTKDEDGDTLGTIIRRLAKQDGRAKELWPKLSIALGRAGLDVEDQDDRLRYTLADGRKKSIAFKTFENRLSDARQNKKSR